MLMNILISGGAGYVGGWVTELLAKADLNVRVLDSLLYEDTYFKPVEFYNLDINNVEDLEEHFRWADTVIWLAALVGDPACSLNPKITINTNFESVKYLANNFTGKIIFPSTCSVYGAQEGLLDENSQLNPLSLYAETKIMAENYLLNNHNNSFIFRLGTLYGVSDHFSRLRADLVVNILTIRAYLESEMSVFGGMQYRPLLHVRDVANAMMLALNSNSPGIYNLHSENYTVLEIAEKVKSLIPDSKIKKTDISFQDARNYKVSSEKVKRDLGFTPEYLIEDGILQIFDLLKSGRIKDVSNPKFSNVLALQNQLKTL